jgi:hypothetical protein
MEAIMARIERQDSNLWIHLVGDNEGFRGDTEKDKRLLISLVGKTSFAWGKYETLAQEANKHDYGLGIIISSSKRNKTTRRKAA